MTSNYYSSPDYASDIALNEYKDHSAAATGSRYQPVQTLSPSKLGRSRSNKSGAGLFTKRNIIIGSIALLVVVAAVVGGVVGSNASKDDDDKASASGSTRNAAVAGVSLDSNGNPIYATTTNTAPGAVPTLSTSNSALQCGPDPYTGGSSSGEFTVRSDHPRLIAPAYKWACLPNQIANDEYLRSWNDTIFANATRFAAMDPTPYTPDGGLSGSGVLDVAREVQLRIKHWAYAWRMSNDTTWATRAWLEIQTAAGNNSDISFGARPDNWNTQHFLDVAEFTAAFAYAYDWMYDAWTEEQRDAIMWSILNLGLNYGLQSYTGNTGYGWWQTTNGNWNCVCNGGLTMGALAILDRDPTGVAQQVLSHTVENAAANCMYAVSSDGTWSETQDYWYFGSTTAAQMISSLMTATGSDRGLLESNPTYNLTGLFHIYGMGYVEKFDHGDCGPNKYTATANNMMFWGEQYNQPLYTLYQRDRQDAPEPNSMFWYNPQVTGDWWEGLPLDHYFPNQTDAWLSTRSSWTNNDGLWAAIKAGILTGHQTHGFLDVGTFVFEALGQRWAGTLCQANYLGDGYFSSEDQDSQRWLYYRTRTEGQNTLLINEANQLVAADPTQSSQSTGEAQTSLSYTPPADSTAFFIVDMTSAYSGASNVQRGLRLLNGRRQMLIQDEVTSTEAVQWRTNTNATISYTENNTIANLALGGENLQIQLLSPSGATFATMEPVPSSNSPATPSGAESQNLPNPGVSVLTISLAAGTNTIQVLFNPQYSGLSASDYVTPPSVALDNWSLTSHN